MYVSDLAFLSNFKRFFTLIKYKYKELYLIHTNKSKRGYHIVLCMMSIRNQNVEVHIIKFILQINFSVCGENWVT